MTLLQELFNKNNALGTYAGVHFSPSTIANIEQYIKNNKIPNPVRSGKLHTTVLYSRKHLPNYEPYGDYDNPLIGTPVELKVWNTQPDNNGNTSRCLVLTYKCDELSKRHDDLMSEHGATWDFPDYTPHITLSYNIGDMELEDFSDISDIGDIEIAHEYHEPLNFDWAQKEGTERRKDKRNE